MKKMLGLLISLMLVFIQVFPVSAAVPAVQARAAVLMDLENGEIIYQRNAFERRAPASTTKILTAILAIETCPLDTIACISAYAAATGEASLHLRRGDKIAVRDLLHGALLKSGNDACVALAEAISPSEAEFVNMMNLKAKVIGTESSTFQNTNGLPDEKHLTTAYDLALIARYAMNNPVFAEIVKKKDYTLKWQNPIRTVTIKSTNKLLWSYPWAIGIKTGTTDKAGKCLIAAGCYRNKRVVAVILNSPDRFGDAQKLLKLGLEEKENY